MYQMRGNLEQIIKRKSWFENYFGMG